MTGDAEYIQHYASVESLALILSCRHIRFFRLDRIDDLRDAQTHLGIESGKYFFTSCWTRSAEGDCEFWFSPVSLA